MTKFEEEFKRPANGPLTELNNNMQEVFSQYRKMRQYADYLEYNSKKKDEEFQELLDKYSNLNDNYEKEVIKSSKLESQIADLKSQLQQQALPVVPECVGEIVELLKKNPETPWSRLCDSLGEEGVNWLNEFQHKDERFGIGELNNKLFVLFHLAINGYTVEKPQLFKLIFPNSTAVLQKDGELNSFAARVYKRYLIGNAMTEQEIKSIDERYWQFAVPVEDGE